MEFLVVEVGKVYTVWAYPEEALATIAEELSKPGIVMVGIGCTERGVID